MNVPSESLQGRQTSITYDEMHTSAGSQSSVTIELEDTGEIPASRTLSRAYGQTSYRLGTYQQED